MIGFSRLAKAIKALGRAHAGKLARSQWCSACAYPRSASDGSRRTLSRDSAGQRLAATLLVLTTGDWCRFLLAGLSRQRLIGGCECLASLRSEPARHRPEADRCAQPREQPGAVATERHRRTHAGRPATNLRLRMNMNLGQTVRFLACRDGQMRNGKVVAMKDTQVTLHEEGTRREWKLPYTAIEAPQPLSPSATAPTRPAQPQNMRARSDFRCGEKVSFDHKYLQPQVRTSSWASTSARPPSTRATGIHGECRSTCCAKSRHLITQPWSRGP